MNYQLVRVLNIFWNDMTRPEIFWRLSGLLKTSTTSEAIYVYRRVTRKKTCPPNATKKIRLKKIARPRCLAKPTIAPPTASTNNRPIGECGCR